MARVPHMDALSRIFLLLILKKVAFNQAGRMQGDERMQGDAHVIMRFIYRIEIIDALKPIVHLFELPCLPLTGLDPIFFLR